MPNNAPLENTVTGGGSSAELSERPQIPDHKLLRPIGGGSYGEVWLAKNVMGSFRAVKLVYRNTFESERPYEREFSGIKKFEPISRSHEGFVDILQVGRNDAEGYFYYVMELADDAATTIDAVSGTESTEFQLDPESYGAKTLSSELRGRGRITVAECLRLSLSL